MSDQALCAVEWFVVGFAVGFLVCYLICDRRAERRFDEGFRLGRSFDGFDDWFRERGWTMSMATDDERREVARRLREHSGARLFTGDDVERLIGAEPSGFRPEDADTNYNLLADLIEPSEPKVKCVAEVKIDGERLEELVHDAAVELTGIDRDALLALADNLDSSASMLMKQNDLDPNRKMRGMRRDHAKNLMAASDRIREALGVQDA